VGTGALWFGLFGGPAAWSVQVLTSYTLMAHACFPGLDALAMTQSSLARPAGLVVTAVMLLVTLVALNVSIRGTASVTPEAHGYAETAAVSHRGTARRYLAFGGILFGALILYNAIVFLTARACGR
jgi:hypothetical protein